MVAQSTAETLSDILVKYGIDCIIGPDIKTDNYPDEIAYNAAVVGDNLFCKKEKSLQIICKD